MNLSKTIPVVLLVLILFSCKKQDQKATGVGDALIVCTKSGTTDVYGLNLYAYTYSAFKSVDVVSSADPGKKYTLKANQGINASFMLETPDSLYTATQPPAATFNFSAVFNDGSTNQFQDELTSKVIAPAIIDTCKFNPKTHMLRITWRPVTDADSYGVNILDGSTIVFGSQEFSNTISTYWISPNGGGWAAGFTPEIGKTYTVKLFAYLYEAQKTAYNLQCISISEASAVFGQ